MTHHLKSYPLFFAATLQGTKTHDIRMDADREGVDGQEDPKSPFAVGDTLVFHEFDPVTQQYSGRIATAIATWMSTESPDWIKGYTILSFRRVRHA